MPKTERNTLHFIIAALCCLWTGLILAETAAPPSLVGAMEQLDEALKAVVTFEHGKDAGPLVRAEQLVVEAAKDEASREAAEERLVRALGSASTRDAKSFLCRQLRTIGTARSVPRLEPLLIDPELSHMARYALGRIEDPAAAAALHRALGKTSGNLQIGIINTLGERRHREALRDLARLLGSPDSGVAEAAATALGRIGSVEAVRALESAGARAPEALPEHIDNALLIAAEQLVADGEKGVAVQIYQRFYRLSRQKHFRLAGLRGLVAVGGERAAPLLVESLKASDPELRRTAISLTTMAKGQNVTSALADALPSLPPEDQELLLGALGERGDRAAVQAVAAATRNEHPSVRVAAIEALGDMGDGTVVPVLVQAAAAGEGNEKSVARASLLRLRGDNVDTALVRSLNSGDANVRVELIHALAGRKAKQAFSELAKLAWDNDATVRREAIRALGTLGKGPELGVLIALAVRPKEATDRPVIEEAIEAVFKRVEGKKGKATPLLIALASAPTDTKPMLVRLLGKAATPEALKAIYAALKDPSEDVREAAVRSLAGWPDAAPSETLLTVARTFPDEQQKMLALQGYVRMAGMSQNPTAMYARAMQLAERLEEKKLVLGGLGSASSAQALAIVEPYLKDERLRTEAATAAIEIASRLRQEDAARARAALENVVSAIDDPRVRKQAQDVINEMEQYEGYVLTWLGSGPYAEKNKESRDIFDTAFPPETPNAEGVKWSPLTQGMGSWDINLEASFGSRDHCAAYLRTHIWSPEEQDARLELGSDDAIKAWLNGKLVHANYTNRGVSPRQDVVNVRLQKGWNGLLLKVVDHEGGWGFCCRVRKPDGSALEGLKVEAK
jgi:HEAT repeat protein